MLTENYQASYFQVLIFLLMVFVAGAWKDISRSEI